MSTTAGTKQVSVHDNVAAEIYAEIGDSSCSEWRRRHPRRDVRVPLDVEIGRRVFRGYTQNVGPNSMSLICRVPAEMHSQIRIRRALEDSPWSVGCVRHCTGTFGGHKIGVEFARSSDPQTPPSGLDAADSAALANGAPRAIE